MSIEVFEADSETIDLKSSNSFRDSKRFKKTALAFISLFKSQEDYQINLKFNWAIFAITEALYLFQFSSLMWRASMPYNNWTTFFEFWRILGYSRTDTVFSNLGSNIIAFYIFSAYIYISIFISIYLIYNSFKKAKPFALFVWILKKQLVLGSSVLFIPFFTHFLSFFLDNFGLYQGKSAGSLGLFYSLQWINSGICMLFHLFFTVLTIVLNCEVAHGECEKHVSSKSSCSIDIKSFIIDFLLVTIYCLLPDSRVQILHCLALICKLWKFISICYFIPYYNKLTNKIVLSRVLSELMLSSLFACNYFINQSSFLFFSSVLIIPLCFVFAFYTVEYRYKFIKNDSQSLNVDLFETSIRDKLMNKEFSVEPIEKFNSLVKKESFVIGNIDYVYVWLAYYCIYNLKDYKLAYIKLAAVNKNKKSVDNYVQVLKIRQLLKENYLNQFEDLCFLDYILKLNRNKILDKEICESYLEFAAEITGKAPSKSKLKTISHVIDQKLTKTVQAYKKICEKYPKGIEARRLLKSFFEDIYTSENFVTSKLMSIENNDSLEINYFDHTNGILIVSGESADLGKIIYSNDRFSSMLKTTSSALTGSDLDSIIPYPYNIGHNATLIRYAKFCTKSLLRFPGSLFLKTEENFLIEFHFKISCVSLTNSIYYLVVAKEITSNQIIVLLSPTGLIYSHSEKFSKLVDIPGLYFENNFIQDLLPQLNVDSLSVNIAEKFMFNSAEWFVVKSKRRIANVEILVLFIVDSLSALDDVIKQNNRESRIEKKNKEKRIAKVKNQETIRVKFNEELSKDLNADEVTGAIAEKTELVTNNKEEEDKKNGELSLKYKNKGISELGMILRACIGKLKRVKILIVILLLCIGSTCITNVVFISRQVSFIENNQLKIMYLNYMDDLLKTSKAVNYIDSGLCVDENIQNLKDILSSIDDLNLRIFDHLGKYASCSDLPLSFNKKSLYFYEVHETMYKNQMTLYDVMEKYRKYIERYLTKVNSETNRTESDILVNNGLSYLYDQAVEDFNRIDTCYNKIAKKYKSIQNTICIVQILILSMFLLLYSWQIVNFIKGTNQVWKKISENAYKSFYSIKSKCCERMMNMLQAREEEVQAFYNSNRQEQNEFSISYSQIGGYFWRFSIIFLLSGIYLLVFYLFLFENLVSISIEKSDFTDSLYFHKLNLEKIENYALIRIKNFDIAQEKIDKLIQDDMEMNLNYFDGITNQKLFEYFLDYKDGQGFLKYGLQNADNLMINENFGLLGADNKTWTDYYVKGTQTYELFDLVINEIGVAGNSKLDEVYGITIAGLVVYFITSFLLALVFYFPYLHKKEVTIQSFQSIFELFISLEIQD